MSPHKSLSQLLHFTGLQRRSGHKRRHRGRVGDGNDAYLRSELRIAGAQQVEDVAVERPHIDLVADKILNDAARIEETADDLAVLRVRVLREEESSPGEIPRL